MVQRIADELGVVLGHVTPAAPRGVETQDVGPDVEKVVHVALAGEEFVDQFGTFVRIVRFKEAQRFVVGRNPADGVEVDPAQKDFVIDDGWFLNPGRLPIGREDAVDFVGLRGEGERKAEREREGATLHGNRFRVGWPESVRIGGNAQLDWQVVFGRETHLDLGKVDD